MNTDIQHTFKALADPSRRMILMHLSQQEMTIKEVSSHFEMTRAAVKKHLNILEKGDLIEVRKQGRERLNILKPEGLRSVNDWMKYFDRYWDVKLNQLELAIKELQEKKHEQYK